MPTSSATSARDVVEVATVGVPFAVFKLVVGTHALGAGLGVVVDGVGLLLVALGAGDLALNVLNAASMLLRRRRLGPVCVLHGVVTRLRGRGPGVDELGLAIDAAVAFVLVAAMIALGQLPLLSEASLRLWNVAVIGNVLGAGALRLAAALRATEAPTGRERS
jgi:hypothetical protein